MSEIQKYEIETALSVTTTIKRKIKESLPDKTKLNKLQLFKKQKDTMFKNVW